MCRGNAAISASRRFVGLLSPMANRIRLWLLDVASFLFLRFFTWNSWTLAHEAWVDGQCRTSMLVAAAGDPYGA